MISSRDSEAIGTLSFIIGGSYKIINKDESDNLKMKYIEIERQICEIKDVKEFREECFMALSNDNMKHTEIFNNIEEIAREAFEVPAYVLLLLGYPYYWRCKYFHGDYIAPLFVAQNGAELKVLKVLNCFLDSFLSREIPLMFEENFWTDSKYESVFDMLKN